MSENRQARQIQLPPDSTQADGGSLLGLLQANLGKEVAMTFLMGDGELTQRAGVLYAVGQEYAVLYDDVALVDTVCRLEPLRFVTFYAPGGSPRVSGSGTAQSARQEERAGAESRGAAPVSTGALNYAKRKARKLD